MKKNQWTESEEKIVKDCIERNQTKGAAFQEASTMMDRTARAIAVHYYTQIQESSTRKHSYKEREKAIIDFLENSNEQFWDSLIEKLGVTKQYLEYTASIIRKKYPEKNLRKLDPRIMSIEELKKIMCEEISKNSNNLREAFRIVSERTGYSSRTIGNYWYGRKGYNTPIKELKRDNMPNLFYRSGSSGTSKNEKNSNKMKVSKGRYVFSFITSLLKGKYKVKSKDKKK